MEVQKMITQTTLMKQAILITLIITIIQITVQTTVHAQTPTPELKFDSLLKVNERYLKQDETKLKLLNQITFGYPNVNPAKGIETGEQAIALAQKLPDKSGQLLLAEAYNNKGLNHATKNENQQAMELYEKALAINEKRKNKYGIAYNNLNIGDILRKKNNNKKAQECFDRSLTIFEEIKNQEGKANTYNKIGTVFLNMSDNDNALDYYQRALNIFEVLSSKSGIASICHNIGLVYFNLSENNKALEYFQKALNLNKAIGNKKYMALNLWAIGNVFFEFSDFPKALEYYQKALSIHDAMGNKIGVASTLNGIGNVYTTLSDYPKALEYFQKSLNIHETLGNKSNMAVNLNNIGKVYFSLSDNLKAMEYVQKAMTINEALGRKNDMAMNLNNIGNLYLDLSDYPKALEYIQKAYNIHESLGDKSSMGVCLTSFGRLYSAMSDFPKALQYYQKAISMNEAMGAKSVMCTGLDLIGGVYRDAPDSVLLKEGIKPTERYTKALEHLNRGMQIAKEIGALGHQMSLWHSISTTYEKQKDFTKAYDAYKNFITIRDSITNDETKKKINQKEMQYEYDKKEASFKYEQQLSDEKLLRQEKELILKKQALTLSNKEKDLQHLAFLKEKAEKQQKENLLTLSEKEKLLQTVQLNEVTKEKKIQQTELELSYAELESKKMQRNIFISGIILLIGLSFYVYSNFVKQKKSNKIIAGANRELKETQQQLVQQEKLASLGSLTAGIAHEIKNPLNFVNNFAELSNELLDELKSVQGDEEKNEIIRTLQQNLQKINEHGKRADGIVKSMLEHSRSGLAEKAPVDINKLIDEYTNLAYHGMRALVADFNCTIEKNFANDLPEIYVVQQDISRVILNLINNAFYAIKDKPDAKLEIITEHVSSPSKAVTIRIIDNGTGIPQSIKEKIFEPFFTTKPSGQGTGLGLSLSFDIVKAHGGKLEVQSEEGTGSSAKALAKAGTEFIITLPI